MVINGNIRYKTIINKLIIMKYIFLFLLIASVASLNFYDKYTNRDLYGLLLRNADIPFFSSKELYSNHYSKMIYNYSNSSKN